MHGGLSQVYKQSFWMCGHGSKTPKRTTLWANSSAVRFFATAKAVRGLGKTAKGPALVDVYTDGRGQRRYKGNKNLRPSQSWSQCSNFRQCDTQAQHICTCMFIYVSGLSSYSDPTVLRKYPVGFGVRFARTVKQFRKERSPILQPHAAT